MKKLFSIAMSCLIMLSTVLSVSANQFETTPEQVIEEALIQYYSAKDIGTEHDFEQAMDSQIAAYLEEKAATYQYSAGLYGFEKINYLVEVSPIEHNVIGDIASYEYQVHASFNYTISPEVMSGYSEIITVVYDMNAGLIVDVYNIADHYDQDVRTETSMISRASAPASFELSNEIQERQNEYRNAIDLAFEVEVTNAFDETLSTGEAVPFSLTRASTLNKTSIVNYALNNARLQYPARGSSAAGAYFDFYTLGGNSYDCTNFVSHAMLAGGAIQKSTSASGIQGNSYWYFRSSANRSSPWSSVNSLYSFMTSNTTANTLGGETFTYTQNGAYWGEGSVIQFRSANDGVWWHSCIITQKVRSSDGERAYALCTGRTGYNWNDYNRPAEDIYPGGAKRVLNPYNN